MLSYQSALWLSSCLYNYRHFNFNFLFIPITTIFPSSRFISTVSPSLKHINSVSIRSSSVSNDFSLSAVNLRLSTCALRCLRGGLLFCKFLRFPLLLFHVLFTHFIRKRRISKQPAMLKGKLGMDFVGR